MLVSFVSMGWRVGIVVAAAVPLTLAVVFVVMRATGKDFDRITLGSLILALGLLVDDAIIAIEMMVVKMEEGYGRINASAYAWSHTAAPMLSGTLVTAVGFMPNGFARSTAGEYTSNMFWIVGIALIASWVVAVVFTPYLGVKLLPDFKKVEGGHDAIYDTPRYNRFRQLLGARHRAQVAGRRYAWSALFVVAVLGMGVVKKQFFPISDRPEVLVEVQMPYGTSIEQTSAATAKVEAWLRQAAGSEDRHGLRRPGRAALLPCDGTGAARSVVRQDRGAHGQPGRARGVETAAAPGDRRRPRVRGARARHPARVRPVFAVPGGLPGHRS